MNNLDNFLQTIFSPYISDPKWYPFILIGMGLLALLVLFIVFLFIRSFIAWVFGVNEVIRLQKEQNALLNELIMVQEEQRDLMEALFIENSETEETSKNFNNSYTDEEMYIDEDSDNIESTESTDLGKNPKVPDEKYQNKIAKKKWFSKK